MKFWDSKISKKLVRRLQKNSKHHFYRKRWNSSPWCGLAFCCTEAVFFQRFKKRCGKKVWSLDISGDFVTGPKLSLIVCQCNYLDA